MKKIDFTSTSFKGFADNEDILIDTGILLAYLNNYDAWNKVVCKLFDKHILSEDCQQTLFLYINPCILNEIMNLTDKNKSLKNYIKKHKSENLSNEDVSLVEHSTVEALKILISNEVLIPLEGNKDVYLKQMSVYKELGSADAFNVSLANEYGISFLTIDNKLVNNIENNISQFPYLSNVYYAPPEKQSY